MATTFDTAAMTDRGPFVASQDELDTIQQTAKSLRQSESGPPKLVTATGEEIALPPTLLRVLLVVAATLAADRAVVLDSLGKLITPHEAAALLRLPITDLVKLLDDGTLSFTEVGDLRLPNLVSVLAYRQTLDARRHEGLDEMTRMSHEWGLYEIDYSTIKTKRLAEFEDEPGQ